MRTADVFDFYYMNVQHASFLLAPTFSFRYSPSPPRNGCRLLAPSRLFSNDISPCATYFLLWFRSCDNCRRRASQRAVRARQLSAAVARSDILTAPPPPLTSPSAPAFSTLHFSCSTCAQPCRSSYRRTCNRCRQAGTRRTVASYQVLGVVRPYLLRFLTLSSTHCSPFGTLERFCLQRALL